MVDKILSRLNNVRKGSNNQWMARCPAHQDHSPSLSVREADDGKILIKCFAGCPTSDVLSAVGLRYSDLFPDSETLNTSAERIAAQQNFSAAKIKAEIDRCRLRLDMARDMRQQGLKLSTRDMEVEREAFTRLRKLKNGVSA